MIGLDTNILVRYFAQDDRVQSRLANRLLEDGLRDEAGYISLVVLVELAWVLTSVYELDKMALIEVLEKVLAAKELEIEQMEIFVSALRAFERTRADFADLIIAASARDAGCSKTLTFDQSAAKKAGMTLLR